MVLVSDGVTHVMSDEEIATTITECRTPQDAAKFLVESALQYGSDDNASALVVPFGFWGKSFSGGQHYLSIHPMGAFYC
ncbi:unnamed protein product [Echinostoma caproni]|uniref:PPM-type phosphatase domain-containing protein n=1 Tax=Echinostoma caproni TaxID=27848 RepID=A0A3P8GTF5_9TREM|nr:unnamed protein product [Echinostoma caproni]